MSDQKIIEKVRKLLALGESPNEAEAAAAMNKAKVLLARYGMTLSDLEKNEHGIIEQELLKAHRLRVWKSTLLAAVLDSCYTQALKIRKGKDSRIILVGRKENIVSAENMFHYLCETIVRISKKYKGTVRHLDSFRFGMVTRIRERLEALDEKPETGSEERALVVAMEKTAEKENSEYLEKQYGRVRKQRRNRIGIDSNSFGQGKAVGNRISLDRQID